MKHLFAIIRTTCLERTVKALEERGIKGITISDVKGTGEQVELFKPYTIHKRIDIIVPDDKADEVSVIILENSHTGLAGDGIIAVSPVDYMIKIKTKERIM